MKIIKEKTVAFVGSHNMTAPKNVSDRNLENVIRTEVFYVLEELYKEGKDTFFIEAKNGFEILTAEAVLEYAETHKGISLYAVTKSGVSEKEDMPVRYKRIFEAVTDWLVVTEERVDDFLIKNSSEIVVYGSGKPEILEQAERNGVEAWNMYDELEGYFSIQSPVKQFLQDYPNISSFRYGREGVIFRGHNQPFPIPFTEITKVEKVDDSLCFKLKDGMVIMASLFSDTCYVKLPPNSRIKPNFLC